MRVAKIEAAGREWAHQLRGWATELHAAGQHARARELERQADAALAEANRIHEGLVNRLARGRA